MSLIPSVEVVMLLSIVLVTAPNRVGAADEKQGARPDVKTLTTSAVAVASVNFSNPLGPLLSIGSGTIVSKHGHIATNYHVLYDAPRARPYDVTIILGWHPKLVLLCIQRPNQAQIDVQSDLALLQCDTPWVSSIWRPIPMRPTRPPIGTDVSVIGFLPAQVAFVTRPGKVIASPIHGPMKIDTPIWQGGSGGAVVDSDGFLVGVAVGYRLVRLEMAPMTHIGIVTPTNRLTTMLGMNNEE